MLLVMTSTTVYDPTKVVKILLWDETLARMHSSRMRTVRCSGCVRGESICPGVVYLGGVYPGGVSAQLSVQGVSAQVVSVHGGVCPGGVYSVSTRGCLPDTPCEQNHRQV